ncbi:hypothetical protein VNO77_02883 [Canavalia gladiata]|uniref:Peptidase M41 domain-containing protein n=1 Tax=Canavalia gladiata TaxID=3824 RepID=A0AAN9MVU6_CANGL
MLQGTGKKTAKLKGSEKEVVGQHESGHAVVGRTLANILPRQPHVEGSGPAFLVQREGKFEMDASLSIVLVNPTVLEVLCAHLEARRIVIEKGEKVMQ